MTILIPFIRFFETGTLILLFVLSVWSIGVMIDRRRVFKSLVHTKELTEVERLLTSGDTGKLAEWLGGRTDILSGLLRVLREVPGQKMETIEPAARSYLQTERRKLEKGFGVLATLGSNAPFIGLFGTVLGVIRAFSALSVEQTGSGVVMSSIAAALVATAAGLFVAIPAVVAYNYFSARLRFVMTSLEAVKNLYLSRCNGR